jgi:diguanylate cyclase (GGDEF)-like protein
MNLLDIKTVLFSYAASNAISMLVIFMLWMQNRRRFVGLGFWFANFVLQFIGLCLIILRGSVPDLVSMTVANALLIGGTILLYVGLERFVGKPGPQIHNLLLLAAFIPAHAYFAVVRPSLSARTVILMLGSLLLCSQCAWLLFHRVDAKMRASMHGTFIVFVGFCLISAARILVNLVFPSDDNFFNPHPQDVLLVMANQMFFILLTLNLFLIVNGRLVADLEYDIRERKQVEEIIQLRLRLNEFAATHSLDELMQKALDEIGEMTHSPIGFYHFVEPDQKTLSLQVWSTRTLKEFCQAEGKGMHYNIDQAGVWVDCVYQRKPIVHNDYAALPHRKGMPAGHAEVVREIVVPTMREGQVVSILGVGNKPSEYDEKDIELVAYIADIVWVLVERKRAEEKIQLLQAELREQVIRDPLTGLYNRRYLDETLERELARAARENYPISFVMIDIDHFKDVNDRFGHAAGDAVLQELATHLMGQTRSGDIVCRYGGEEFLVVLLNVTTEAAYQIVERWRLSFLEATAGPDHMKAKATISCGISEFPIHGRADKELIARADKAMYHAKAVGRNHVVIWQNEWNA